jgi:serine/threonine-protein kinase
MTAEVTSFQGSRYQVLRKLGEGGKGIVFLCQDTVLRRQVAIKLLKEEGLDEEGLLRFQREVQAMASLVHPNVVTVFDIGQEGGRHFLVLELMEGGDVENLIASAPNQRLDAATAVRIAKEVARALEHAHRHSILHRDVKPGNVWLTTRSASSGQAQGVAKLGDFGLAYLGGSTRLTQAGMMVGSIAYMAPEVALGRPADQRSDLYMLGAGTQSRLVGTRSDGGATPPTQRTIRTRVPSARDSFPSTTTCSPWRRPARISVSSSVRAPTLIARRLTRPFSKTKA